MTKDCCASFLHKCYNILLSRCLFQKECVIISEMGTCFVTWLAREAQCVSRLPGWAGGAGQGAVGRGGAERRRSFVSAEGRAQSLGAARRSAPVPLGVIIRQRIATISRDARAS